MFHQQTFGYKVKTLKRITTDLNQVLKADDDASLFAVDEEGHSLPYLTQIVLPPVEIKDFFEILEKPRFMVVLYIFINEEEKTKFILKNRKLFTVEYTKRNH